MSMRRSAAALVLAGAAATPGQEPPPAPDGFEAVVRPFLRQHCLRCHGERRPKGGLRLDELAPDFVDGPTVDRWREVALRLASGEMPPEDEPERPAVREGAAIVEWLSERIEEGEAARLAGRAPLAFQRLTREEYANTVRDLLGVDFDVADAAGLLPDDRWRGFERIGPALTLSAAHVERYLAAAEAILAEAYPTAPPEPTRQRRDAVALVGGPAAYGEERFEVLRRAGRADDVRVDLWPGQLVRAAPDGGWRRAAGRFRIRAQVSGLGTRDGRSPHLVLRAETLDRLLFERDVVAPEGAPVVVEAELHLPVGEHVFTLANEVNGPTLLTRLGREGRPFLGLEEGRLPWQIPLVDDDAVPLHPLLVLDWVEWEGPLADGGERERYLPAEDGVARGPLAQFAERAFRRSLQPGELEPYLALVEGELAAGGDLRAALTTGMLAVLCSDDFLYLRAGSPDGGAAALDAWQLASRLSYFLWSTMPDEELLDAAASGALQQPDGLRAQLARLLDDPRSMRFAQSFARQWLRLDEVGRFAPDLELYPDYDGSLERSMVRETTAFFGAVLDGDLGLRELLDSDWTVLDPRLARHYGIPGVAGPGFRRVALEPEHHRGGLLTQASVLSLTSDGRRHRPVHRGAWLSEVILGRVPPPPPANVEPLEPTPPDAPRATVRAKLEAHASDPSCATCHERIDPLGFAFDNYDAIGRWREVEVDPAGSGANPPVDASGVLPDGRSFSGPHAFRELLVEDLDRFAAAFVEQLATYALRRPMTADDRAELERVAARCAADGYRLRQLVEALVLSPLFAAR